MFRPIHWVVFRSIQLYVRVQDNRPEDDPVNGPKHVVNSMI